MGANFALNLWGRIMLTQNKAQLRVGRVYRKSAECDVADLAALTGQQTDLANYPLAASVQKNVLIYDCDALRQLIDDGQNRRMIMAEWSDALMTGPGVVVLKRAETDHGMIDHASDVFRAIIDEQNRAGTAGGDHFAKPGANDRIWNSLEKHCLADPVNFSRYYSNPFLALISEAWLGPHYQMTAQLNVVNPGGAAQSPHRDYHLGFQSADDIERYPVHVQTMSHLLTLQGAIAHVDAPMETGPTLLLPYSQLWVEGYLAMTRADVKAHFAANHVQLPLEKGDMLFFSPALLHAAGTNRSVNVKRMVNLFQVSSAYGRAMESVDRVRMVKALYPVLLAAKTDGSLTSDQIAAALASAAEGYSFPTNLDRDPPIGGMAPKTQKQLVTEALASGQAPSTVFAALDAQVERKLT
jgi:ectoine hydroxylase-related dioxygenase (phytanoyl-CoA dioxygenase family)